MTTTSPSSRPAITGTAWGAVLRRSERSIDCPVNVIVRDWGSPACEPATPRIAIATRAPPIAAASLRPAFTFEATVPMISALVGVRVHLDPRHVGASNVAVPAAGHEIDPPEFVDAAQVGIIDFLQHDHLLRIEQVPALILEGDLGHHEAAGEHILADDAPLR